MAKQTKKKTSRSKNTQNSNPLLSIEALAVFLIVYCLLAIFQLGFLGKFFANVIRFFIGDLFVFGGVCGGRFGVPGGVCGGLLGVFGGVGVPGGVGLPGVGSGVSPFFGVGSGVSSVVFSGFGSLDIDDPSGSSSPGIGINVVSISIL